MTPARDPKQLFLGTLSGRRHLEEVSWRRHHAEGLVGGGTQEAYGSIWDGRHLEAFGKRLGAFRRTREAPGDAQETPRRHPGGTQEAPRRHPGHPGLQRRLGHKK